MRLKAGVTRKTEHSSIFVFEEACPKDNESLLIAPHPWRVFILHRILVNSRHAEPVVYGGFLQRFSAWLNQHQFQIEIRPFSVHRRTLISGVVTCQLSNVCASVDKATKDHLRTPGWPCKGFQASPSGFKNWNQQWATENDRQLTTMSALRSLHECPGCRFICRTPVWQDAP